VVAEVRPTIVLLHGTRLSGAEWAVHAAELADEFHVLTPDLPGHGTAAGDPFTLDGAADAVAALIATEAHGGRAVLVGLSLGGYVAMAVAARRPELVAGLAISGATAEPIGPRALLYRGLAALYDTVPEAALAAVTARWFRWRFPSPIVEPILAAGFSFAGGATALWALVGERFRPRLAAYPGPSLLLNGELDPVFRPTEASFARVAANPRRLLIRRGTHLANLDQPEAFTAAIRRFARSVGGPMVSSPDRPNPS
jgi:pimeloyl-ACP methyl ester carboxylesterase